MPCSRILRNAWTAIVLLAGAAVTAVTASAQDYPNRPITLVVPFPPGGSTTIVARIVADKMSDALGPPIVLDNRAGRAGSGRPSSGAVADAPRRRFEPVGRVGLAPNTPVMHPPPPVHSVSELIP